MLLERGLDPYRAWKLAVNGRGPWWNAGASHMHTAVPDRYLATCGLVSLYQTHQRLKSRS